MREMMKGGGNMAEREKKRQMREKKEERQREKEVREKKRMRK